MQVCHLLSLKHLVFPLHGPLVHGLKSLSDICNDVLSALFAFADSLTPEVGILSPPSIPLKVMKDIASSREVNISEWFSLGNKNVPMDCCHCQVAGVESSLEEMTCFYWEGFKRIFCLSKIRLGLI